MSENRVHVWVQEFNDRPNLMLQWLDPETGQRKSKSAGTADPKDAEQARADHEYELTHGRYQEASRMSWERFREIFEAEHLSGLREDTQRTFKSALTLFETICNPERLRSISERTLSGFVAGMRKRKGHRNQVGLQPNTMHTRLLYLHIALKWAEDQKLIARCPKFPKIKVPKTRPRPIPAESFERLHEKADGDQQMQTYLLCGWLAGLRLREAMALEWEETAAAPWVDLERDRIWLPAGFVKASVDQWVPIDPVLREALLAMPRHGRKVFRFLSARGEPIQRCSLSTRICDLAKKAGVKLTMQALRKGFGCRYAGKVPAQVLQKLMRHANIAMTMDYYANVDDAVEAAVLGPQCNTRRNSGRKRSDEQVSAGDATNVVDESSDRPQL